jgi:hypothetical protein
MGRLAVRESLCSLVDLASKPRALREHQPSRPDACEQFARLKNLDPVLGGHAATQAASDDHRTSVDLGIDPATQSDDQSVAFESNHAPQSAVDAQVGPTDQLAAKLGPAAEYLDLVRPGGLDV